MGSFPHRPHLVRGSRRTCNRWQRVDTNSPTTTKRTCQSRFPLGKKNAAVIQYNLIPGAFHYSQPACSSHQEKVLILRKKSISLAYSFRKREVSNIQAHSLPINLTSPFLLRSDLLSLKAWLIWENRHQPQKWLDHQRNWNYLFREHRQSWTGSTCVSRVMWQHPVCEGIRMRPHQQANRRHCIMSREPTSGRRIANLRHVWVSDCSPALRSSGCTEGNGQTL